MMKEKTLQGALESLLFMAGDEGLSLADLAHLTEMSEPVVREKLNEMKKYYEEKDQHGLLLTQFGEEYRFVTKSLYKDEIEQMFNNPTKQMLTQASLEVLAIIAYEQPVTKAAIDEIRGVGSEGPVQTLVARGLIEEKGRLEQPGNPKLYGTTQLFLDRFGLQTLEDLPALEVETTLDDMKRESEKLMQEFQATFQEEE